MDSMSAVEDAEKCLYELTRTATNSVSALIVMQRFATAASESRGDSLTKAGEALA